MNQKRGGARDGAGRRQRRYTLSEETTNKLYFIAQQNGSDRGATLSRLIDQEYEIIRSTVMITSNGIEITGGTQVLIRGIQPAVIVANEKTGQVIGLWAHNGGARKNLIEMGARDMWQTTNQTLEKFSRYPLTEKDNRDLLVSGKPFQNWQVNWWLEPNNNPATFIDAEAEIEGWHQIHYNS